MMGERYISQVPDSLISSSNNLMDFIMPTTTNSLPSDEDEKLMELELLDIEANNATNLEALTLLSPGVSSLIHPAEPTLVHKIFSYPPANSLEIKATSWLDGVRGVAALGVYIFHAMGCWTDLVPAWHSGPEQNNILQLPLIRTIFVSGGASVSIFFALSGYVLTHKSLRWMRGGVGERVYSSVTSSMFRRGFRLYLPPVILTFVEMLTTRLGFGLPFNFTFKPESSLGGQIVDWLVETNHFINPFFNMIPAIRGHILHPKYDGVVWTMPLEFYGSFVCYFLLLALVRVQSNNMRMCLLGMLSVVFMLLSSWNMFCFSSGMLIADFNLSQDLIGPKGPGSTIPRIKTLFWSILFSISFYVAGFPPLSVPEAFTRPKPGYTLLYNLIPGFLTFEDPGRFWWSTSGVLLLLSISQLPVLKRVFETNVCQYLGKISFSLYLIHTYCVLVFGLSIQHGLMWITGVQEHAGTVGYWSLCVIWYAIFTTVVFGLAAVFERAIDQPSVRFARWLEVKTLRKWMA